MVEFNGFACVVEKRLFALSVFSGFWVGQAESKRSPEPHLSCSVKGWESSQKHTEQLHSQVPDEMERRNLKGSIGNCTDFSELLI